MPTVSFSLRTEEEQRDRLDKVAESLGRNRNWCINEAIDQYLALYEWQVDHIQKGKAASDAGLTLSTDEVRARLAAHQAKRKAEAADKAALAGDRK